MITDTFLNLFTHIILGQKYFIIVERVPSRTHIHTHTLISLCIIQNCTQCTRPPTPTTTTPTPVSFQLPTFRSFFIDLIFCLHARGLCV